jgi:hypothetical protein
MAVRDSTDQDYATDGNGQSQAPPSWEAIINAPPFETIVKTTQTATAKEYSSKVRSMLRSGVVGAINVNDFPDAAAILVYGPGFADAAGQLASADKRAERALDILTSPNSPWLTFALTSVALGAQLFRNHETQFQEIPSNWRNRKLRRKAMAEAKQAEAPRFTIRMFGREWPIRFRSRIKPGKLLAPFRAQTQDPEALTINVFTDPKVIQQLAKMGVRIQAGDSSPQA